MKVKNIPLVRDLGIDLQWEVLITKSSVSTMKDFLSETSCHQHLIHQSSGSMHFLVNKARLRIIHRIGLQRDLC